jgi:hypothetical protein
MTVARHVAPMMADVNAAQFPADWTVYVACDAGTWQSIKQRVGGVNTDAAITDRQHKVTIVNGLLYNPVVFVRRLRPEDPRANLKTRTRSYHLQHVKRGPSRPIRGHRHMPQTLTVVIRHSQSRD